MVDRVKKWLGQGKEVKIFTARVTEAFHLDATPMDLEPVRKAIQSWCFEHIGEVLEITNVKDYGMIELWDDRAVGVVPNTGARI